jgi:hypothetical protein
MKKVEILSFVYGSMATIALLAMAAIIIYARRMPIDYSVADGPINCEENSLSPGILKSGLAKNPQVAGKIALLIIDDILKSENSDRISKITVTDRNDRWLVKAIPKSGYYGGGVEMEISKCEASIIRFSRSE